jgi:hypothetical protein
LKTVCGQAYRVPACGGRKLTAVAPATGCRWAIGAGEPGIAIIADPIRTR